MSKLKALFLALLHSKVGQVAVQAAAAFAVTALAQLVASGWFTIPHITDTSLLTKAAVAGLGAALAVVRSVVAALVSGGYAITLGNAVRYRVAVAKSRKAADR